VKEERPESVVQKEGEECRGNLAPLEAPEDKACQEGLGSQESPENLADLVANTVKRTCERYAPQC